MIKTNIWYILWFGVYFNYSFYFLQSIFGAQAFIINVLFYAFSLFVAHFFGDTIFKILEGARILETKREKEYLLPLFEEVYQDVKELYPSLPKIKLHIVDTMTANAMAIGNHTVAVTQGAIDTFSAEELKGIIAHEISHIYYGDTKVAIINTIGNGIFAVLTFFIKLFIRGLEYIAMMCESTVIQAVLNLLRYLLELCIFVMLWLGELILSFNSRSNELKADKFAFDTGYGGQLTEALYIIQKMSLGQKMKLVHKMIASHPRTSKRIGRLEELEDQAII